MGRIREKTLGKKKRPLTHLESVALGIVWKHKGCTAYEVMTQFSQSLTAQFKSGAGSIYPIMKRLHADQLVVKKEALRGKQEKAVYTITRKGRSALSNWMSPSVAECDAALNADPIRSRVYFLGILPPSGRLDFIDSTLHQLKASLDQLENSAIEFREAENTFGVLAMKGAIAGEKARIRWLNEIRELVVDLP